MRGRILQRYQRRVFARSHFANRHFYLHQPLPRLFRHHRCIKSTSFHRLYLGGRRRTAGRNVFSSCSCQHHSVLFIIHCFVFVAIISIIISAFSVIQVSSLHFSNADGLASASEISEGLINRHGSDQSNPIVHLITAYFPSDN